MFGLTAEEVESARKSYNPAAVIEADEDLRGVMQLLHKRHFSMSEPDLFEPIMHAISNPHDPWLTAADFPSYVAAQERVAKAYRDMDGWVKMSILNSASSGRFSTDRTIAEYNDGIWRLSAIPAYAVKQTK